MVEKQRTSEYMGESSSAGSGESRQSNRRETKRKYFTTSQLMSRWGVSAPTVIRLIEEGQLRGLKIRGVYRVEMSSVESYEQKVSF